MVLRWIQIFLSNALLSHGVLCDLSESEHITGSTTDEVTEEESK